MSLFEVLAPPMALTAHAPALMVTVPILLAALIAAIRAPGGITALAGTAFCLWLAIGLAALTSAGETAEYAFGGWEAPVGIVFRVDAASAWVALIIAAVGFVCALANPTLVKGSVPAPLRDRAHAAALLCLGGLLGVVLTGDVFNLFVFVEISSLSAYALIALGGRRDRRAYRAAFDYLIMGSIGATFYLLGVGFLYAATGTLNMEDIALRVAALPGDRAVAAGLTLIVVGLGLKAALFPVHLWLPASYAHAPSFVTALLSATATKAALYALARILFGLGASAASTQTLLEWFLAPLAAIGIMTCSVQALLQSDVRRTLAYSSVAQSGYMLLALALGNPAGLTAALLHLFAHATMKCALFMSLGGMSHEEAPLTLGRIAGAGGRAPATMGAFAVCALSLAGLPLTLGFASKWTLLSAMTASGWYWAAAIVAVSSVLAFFYVGRILAAAYLRPAPNLASESGAGPGADGPVAEAPLMVLVPLAILVGANVGFGLAASPLLGMAAEGARALLAPVAGPLP